MRLTRRACVLIVLGGVLAPVSPARADEDVRRAPFAESVEYRSDYDDVTGLGAGDAGAIADAAGGAVEVMTEAAERSPAGFPFRLYVGQHGYAVGAAGAHAEGEVGERFLVSPGRYEARVVFRNVTARADLRDFRTLPLTPMGSTVLARIALKRPGCVDYPCYPGPFDTATAALACAPENDWRRCHHGERVELKLRMEFSEGGEIMILGGLTATSSVDGPGETSARGAAIVESVSVATVG